MVLNGKMIEMDEMSAIKQLMDDLLTVKGIVDVVMLPATLKREIQASETTGECQSDGFFAKVNAGVKEVLKREFLVAAITNDDYEYPPEPVELIYMGDTVGEEIRDKKSLEGLRSDPNAILLGDSFVLYKDRLPKDSMRKAMTGQIRILIPPMSVGLKDEKNVYGLVLGMPCTQTDVYLKEWLKCNGIDLSNERLGVILIGFNVMR